MTWVREEEKAVEAMSGMKAEGDWVCKMRRASEDSMLIGISTTVGSYSYGDVV